MKEFEPIRFPEGSNIEKLHILHRTEPRIKTINGSEGEALSFVGVADIRNAVPQISFGFRYRTEGNHEHRNNLRTVPGTPVSVLTGVLGMQVLEELDSLDSDMLRDIRVGVASFLGDPKEGAARSWETTQVKIENPVQHLAKSMSAGLIGSINTNLVDYVAQTMIAKGQPVDWQEFSRNFTRDYMARTMPFVHTYAIAPYN